MISWSYLDLDGILDGLALLLSSGNGLGTHDATTPVTLALLVLLAVTLLDGADKLGQFGLVFRADFSQSQNSSSLETH